MASMKIDVPRRAARCAALAIIAGAIAIPMAPAQGQFIYGVNASDEGLSMIDGAAGTASFIGILGEGFNQPSALAIRFSDDALFAWSNSDLRGLLAVDGTTGQATLMGTSDAVLTALTFTFNDILYGAGAIGGGPKFLYQVNPTTAAVTQVGDGLGMPLGGMDTHPSTGVIYAIERTTPTELPALVTVNTITGATSTVATLNTVVGQVQSVVFDRFGTLTGAAAQGPLGKVLFQVNLGTGLVSNIRPIQGTATPLGMASVPPCPGTGNCCLANGTPGCNDNTCCEAVCTADPTCCDVAWDADCADLASIICPVLCMPSGSMHLELPVPSICQSSTQVCVELWMRELVNTDVTGWRAFVAFNDTIFNYNTVDSEYTIDPFPLHIRPIEQAEIQAGLLDLDGSINFNDGRASNDALLATLCFDVAPGQDCSSAAFTFIINGPNGDFTHLSFEGVPIFTRTNNTAQFVLDDEDPVFDMVPADLTLQCGESTDPDNTGYATATDNCGAPTVNHFDTFAPDCHPDVGLLMRTWTAVDTCGNVATHLQMITIQDTIKPIINDGNPLPTLLPPADVGECSSSFNPTQPPATDNCADPEDLVYQCSRSDGMHCFNDPYPCGQEITLSWTARDPCNNTSLPAQQLVFVPCVNRVFVDITLKGAMTSCSVSSNCCIPNGTPGCDDPTCEAIVCGVDPFCCDTAWDGICADEAADLCGGLCDESGSCRCIRFVTDDCSTADYTLPFSVPLSSLADARFQGTIDIPCGLWSDLCIKDRQHTLWGSATMTIGPDSYTASRVILLGGDTNNNGDVDIDDVTWLLLQFADPPNDGDCPWNETTRDANFDNDMFVDADDYSIILENWDVPPTSCDCVPLLIPGGLAAGSGGGGDMGASQPFGPLPPEVLQLVDFNDDHRIDWQDVKIFEDNNGLPNSLSEVMRLSPQDTNSVREY